MKIQGHPNVCRCEGCFDAFRPGTSQAQYIMIVMELVNGGELAGFIKDGQKSLAEDVAKNVVRQPERTSDRPGTGPPDSSQKVPPESPPDSPVSWTIPQTVPTPGRPSRA